jgi:hypothetical protein
MICLQELQNPPGKTQDQNNQEEYEQDPGYKFLASSSQFHMPMVPNRF